jgi:hypothetical protein
MTPANLTSRAVLIAIVYQAIRSLAKFKDLPKADILSSISKNVDEMNMEKATTGE